MMCRTCSPATFSLFMGSTCGKLLHKRRYLDTRLDFFSPLHNPCIVDNWVYSCGAQVGFLLWVSPAGMKRKSWATFNSSVKGFITAISQLSRHNVWLVIQTNLGAIREEKKENTKKLFLSITVGDIFVSKSQIVKLAFEFLELWQRTTFFSCIPLDCAHHFANFPVSTCTCLIFLNGRNQKENSFYSAR